MRTLALVLSLMLAVPAAAQESPEWHWLTPRCRAKIPSPDPARNAVLYALPTTVAPGCYASGSTALARNAAGQGVAMTFTRNSVAYYYDTFNGSWWKSCPANQLRVSGAWSGAMLDAPGTNLLAAPADAPVTGGAWSVMAAGPTLTANLSFMDSGPGTATAFVESAAANPSGIQQSVTVTAQAYAMSAWLYGGSAARLCWGYAINNTVYAKFNIFQGSVTYQATGTYAGVEHGPAGWVRPWVVTPTLGAGTVPVQWFATTTCTDNAIAATGATASTTIANLQFEAAVGTSAAQPTTWAAPGTNRPVEALTFPVSLPDGNVCVSFKAEPRGSPWDARSASGFVWLGSSPTNKNYIGIRIQAGTFYFDLYDDTPAVKRVSFLTTGIPWNQPRVVKACASADGAMILSIDGARTTVTAGAGTGILSSIPNLLRLGEHGGGAFPASIAISDVLVCNTSDPDACGDVAKPAPKMNAAIGDSITVGAYGGATIAWPQRAATLSGTNVFPLARVAWKTPDALAAYLAEQNHRWNRVAILLGTNNANDNLGWEGLRRLYEAIIANGGTPIPMTIIPGGATGAAETQRLETNKAILAWCARTGYRCADLASAMADPAQPNFMRAEYYTVGDTVHPNQTGQDAIAAFMAPYFQ